MPGGTVEGMEFGEQEKSGHVVPSHTLSRLRVFRRCAGFRDRERTIQARTRVSECRPESPPVLPRERRVAGRGIGTMTGRRRRFASFVRRVCRALRQ